jgi:hypothetical protein
MPSPVLVAAFFCGFCGAGDPPAFVEWAGEVAFPTFNLKEAPI